MHPSIESHKSAPDVTLLVVLNESPSDTDRLRLRDSLRQRVELVHEHGWAEYEESWSSSSVLGVRAVLNEPGAEDAACPIWAPLVWGPAEAERDALRDYSHTRWWLSTVMLPGEDGPIDSTWEVDWDIAPGWTPITDALQADLERIDPGVTVDQVKAKFGLLRVYVTPSAPALSEQLLAVIDAAERESGRTCEDCGQQGRTRSIRRWLYTLRDVHAADGSRWMRP